MQTTKSFLPFVFIYLETSIIIITYSISCPCLRSTFKHMNYIVLLFYAEEVMFLYINTITIINSWWLVPYYNNNSCSRMCRPITSSLVLHRITMVVSVRTLDEKHCVDYRFLKLYKKFLCYTFHANGKLVY